MAANHRELRDWFVHQATCTPSRALLTRYLGTLAFIAGMIWIIPRSPLEGPVGGILALSSILVCCWYAGGGPSILVPALVVVMSRLGDTGTPRPLVLSSRELMAFVAMTILTATVGFSGQYRRRFLAVTRRYEARTRQHIRALSLASILFRDLDGRITSWPDGAVQLWGWTSAEATGRLVQELLQTEFPKSIEDIQRELTQNRQWRGEVKQRRKDGRQLIIATHWILYDGEGDEQDGVVEVHNDVTELPRAEAVVRESEHRKDLFIATLAHELRNPLAPIRNSLECLRLSGQSETLEPLYEIMRRQLEQLVRLVDDLLDVSRISSGKIELRREQVALQQIVGDAIVACRPQIEGANHKLTVLLPDKPIYLHADSVRLVQVLTNLLHNAAKFTEPGGWIALSVSCSTQQVEIGIKDSGIGIPAESLSHIFDVFSQVHDVRTRMYGGLGLGLSIVKSLVAMHEGTVEVRSEGLDRGTEFVIRLPAVINPTSLAQDENSSIAMEPASNSCRVLVVDDNQDAARTMAMVLNTLGCTCRSVFDGMTALRLAEEFEPHVFVLDLGMPGMSGLDLARRLRAQSRFRNAILIAVTGWDKDEDRRRSSEAGFDYHFAKPVDIGLLKDILQPGTVAAN